MRPIIDQQVTFLYTTDLENTTKFYEELLGLELVLDQGACRIYRVTADSFLGICLKQDLEGALDRVIFTMVTSQVDGWYAYLSERGAEIEKEPAFNPKFNIYHFFLRDPEGYLIEIQEFRDAGWPRIVKGVP